jgi:hypothetical protein
MILGRTGELRDIPFLAVFSEGCPGDFGSSANVQFSPEIQVLTRLKYGLCAKYILCGIYILLEKALKANIRAEK